MKEISRRDFLKAGLVLGGASLLSTGWKAEDWFNPIHPSESPKDSTPTPEPTATPTVEKKSKLVIELEESLVERLNVLTREAKALKWFKKYSAKGVIEAMNLTNPELVRIYKALFDGNWQHPIWPDTNYHGLGIYTMTKEGKKPVLHTALGLFYGFVPIKNVPQTVIDMSEKCCGVFPQPYYAILQIRPGNNLTPERNPEAFIAVKMGMNLYRGEFDGTGFAVGVVKTSSFETQVVNKNIEGVSKSARVIDSWTPNELKDAFGLDKGSVIFVVGKGDVPGELSASWFSIIVNQEPSNEVKTKFHFYLD